MDVKNKKEVAAQRQNMTRYFSVVSGIRKGDASCGGMFSKFQLYRIRKRLISEGIIIKKGYGTWDINDEKLYQFLTKRSSGYSGGDGHPMRGHGFHWKLSLAHILPLDKLGKYLEEHKLKFRYSKDGHGLGLDVRGYRVWVYHKCIMLYCPDGRNFYAWTAAASSKLAYDDILAVIHNLENMLGGTSLRMSNGYALRCTHQHYAHIKDSLAKLINAEKQYLEVRDSKGELWLLFDKSNTDEMETVHQVHAVPDWDKVIAPFHNDLREHYRLTGEPLVMSFVLKALYSMIKANPGLMPSSGFPEGFQRDSSKDRKLGDYIG